MNIQIIPPEESAVYRRFRFEKELEYFGLKKDEMEMRIRVDWALYLMRFLQRVINHYKTD